MFLRSVDWMGSFEIDVTAGRHKRADKSSSTRNISRPELSGNCYVLWKANVETFASSYKVESWAFSMLSHDCGVEKAKWVKIVGLCLGFLSHLLLVYSVQQKILNSGLRTTMISLLQCCWCVFLFRVASEKKLDGIFPWIFKSKLFSKQSTLKVSHWLVTSLPKQKKL